MAVAVAAAMVVVLAQAATAAVRATVPAVRAAQVVDPTVKN